MITYLTAFLCVLGLTAGQILFKLSSSFLTKGGSFFEIKVLISLFSALCLYGITSIAWVWILQKIELGRIYPMMALAFILVPLGSHFVFREQFNTQYFVGVFLISIGIITTIRS